MKFQQYSFRRCLNGKYLDSLLLNGTFRVQLLGHKIASQCGTLL